MSKKKLFIDELNESSKEAFERFFKEIDRCLACDLLENFNKLPKKTGG